jgi:hypothetical protein
MPARRRRSTPGWLMTAAGVAAVVFLASAAVYVLNSTELLNGGDTSVVDKSSNEDAATEPRRETAGSNVTATANPPKTTPVIETPAEAAEGTSSAVMPAEEEPTEETPVSVTPIAEVPASETPPAEMPAEEPVETATPPTPAEIASLVESLKAARAALVKHDVGLAKRELDKAAPLARTPPYSQSYEQLAELVAKATEFWAAFDSGAASLKADQELTFGSTTVIVVEVKDGRLSYEVAGLKRTKALRDLPLGLSIAVAEKGMSDPQSADSIVIKAAPLAVQPIDALASQGRTLWQEAEKKGASVQGLLAAVDDKYEFASSGSASNSASAAPESSPTPAGMSAGLGKLLASTRQALVEHEVERAVADLAKAERLLTESPASDVEKAKFDRLRLLTDYLTQFWSVVGDSLAGLEVGEEIIVRDMPVAVIAATRDSLEVRTQGESHRFTIGNMPAGLALALAKMRLNENAPSTKMMSAALYAVQKDDSFHTTARKLWEEAASAGVDVGDLPLVLEDRYE